MKKILFLVTLAGSLVGLAKTPGELARENRALVEKYGKSVATVRYYVKKNADGIEPKFEIPYQCPNCKNTHWRDEGVSADDGIPAEFAGYVIGRDEVVIQDVMVAPEFVDRIEVTCAGETVAAQEVAACPAENALVLRTANGVVAAGNGGASTIKPDAQLLFVAGAGWTKKQADGAAHLDEAAATITGFLAKSGASLGSSKSLVDMPEAAQAFSFMSHMNQVGQTGATPRHAKGLSTCCHGEEPHVVGWRFIGERRAVNLDANCGWAQGKADVLYVADAFEVMKKVNALLG